MDQVDPGALHFLAVEPRRQHEPRRIGNLVGGDDPGTKRAGAVEVLPAVSECF